MGILDSLAGAVIGGEGAETIAPHLQDSVAPNTSDFDHETAYTIPFEGVITGLRAWHVPNSQDALRIKPVVRKKGQVPDVDIPAYGNGEEFITGEPTDAQYVTYREVEREDEIVITATNTNGTNAYRFRYVPTIVKRGAL